MFMFKSLIVHSCIASLFVICLSPLAVRPQCEAEVDLYFLIDSTNTLGDDGHEKMRNMVVNLVNEIPIGTNQDTDLTGLSRVDVIQFWGVGTFFDTAVRRATVDIELGNYADKTDLLEKIKNLTFKEGGATFIAHGLHALYQEIVKHNDSRRKIIALVLTDGRDDSTSDDTRRVGTLKEIADDIKAKNVSVFAIGFQGSDGRYDENNLKTIASQDNFIFDADVGVALNKTYNRLIESLCPDSGIPLRPTPGEFN